MLKKEIYNFYIPIINKYKILFVFMALSGIISGVKSVIVPVLLKLETDQLVDKKSLDILGNHLGPFELFLIILIVILFVEIIESLLSSLSNIFSKAKQEMLEHDIQYELYCKMQKMEIGKSLSSRYKYISKIVSSDFSRMASDIIGLPRNVFSFLIRFFGISVVFAYFDIKLLLVVIISTIIGYAITNISEKVRTKYEIDRKFTVGRKLENFSRLFMYNFSELAISGGMLTILKGYRNVLLGENKKNIKKDFSDLIRNIQDLLNYNLRDIILKLIVGYGVFAGTKSVGMVVLVVSSMGTITDLLKNIFGLRFTYREFSLKQESVLLMLRMCTPSGNKDFNEKINSIEIKNLKFSYPNMAIYEKEYIEILQKTMLGKLSKRRSRIDDQIKNLIEVMEEESKQINSKIFSQVNLHFEKAKVYGLVGKNGAGKTTLMYLLSGFFKEYEGEIFYNGISSKDFTTESFLKKVSFLTQTPFDLVWGYSIRESILLGCDREISDDEIFSYLDKFGIAKKIKKHKKGLDAELGDDIEFSGGEKQIIAIIRLLLQDRDIIIMDEGTNQLDAENEILVMDELLKNKKDKIIIFITHRMSTISKADEIYCLENGIITDFGTHKELLNSHKNAYARFYKAQIG